MLQCTACNAYNLPDAAVCAYCKAPMGGDADASSTGRKGWSASSSPLTEPPANPFGLASSASFQTPAFDAVATAAAPTDPFWRESPEVDVPVADRPADTPLAAMDWPDSQKETLDDFFGPPKQEAPAPQRQSGGPKPARKQTGDLGPAPRRRGTGELPARPGDGYDSAGKWRPGQPAPSSGLPASRPISFWVKVWGALWLLGALAQCMVHR